MSASSKSTLSSADRAPGSASVPREDDSAAGQSTLEANVSPEGAAVSKQPENADAARVVHALVGPASPRDQDVAAKDTGCNVNAATTGDALAASSSADRGEQRASEAAELELAEARKRRRQWLHHTERDDPEEAFQKERPFLQHIPLAAVGAGPGEPIPEPLLRQLRRNPYGDSRASALAYSLGFGGRLLLQSAALVCRHVSGMWRPPAKGRSIRRIGARKIDNETGTVYYWCAIRPDTSTSSAQPDTWRWLRRRTLQRLAPAKLLDFDRRHPETPHVPRVEMLKVQGQARYTREALDPCLLSLDIGSGQLRLEIYASHVELVLPQVYVRPYRPTLHLAGKVRTCASADATRPAPAVETTSSFYARLRNALTGAAAGPVAPLHSAETIGRTA
ncbi:hypothetical protein CCYA_CCYA15G3989 [Cyanidiococcus yangmingshanensis]|nr:hypothetical protein CCYA_CCYA15G3989 [Cyanidiococcus yangmingshanensis]